MTNYNLTNVSNSNNLAESFVAVNELTGSYLSILILFVLFIIIYFNVTSTQFNRKIMAASLGTTFVGGLFFFAGMISFYIASISPILFLVSIIYEAFD